MFQHYRNITSIGTGHNGWLRALFPARRAGLAEASRIERQGLNRPLGGLCESALSAGLPIPFQTVLHSRTLFGLSLARPYPLSAAEGPSRNNRGTVFRRLERRLG